MPSNRSSGTVLKCTHSDYGASDESRIVIFRHYLDLRSLGNLRACCLPQLRLRESPGPGKTKAPNLKRKTLEEDWNLDRKLKRPRKLKLEDEEERKKVEEDENVEDRQILEENEIIEDREAIKNTGTLNHPRDYQTEGNEKKEKEVMQCAGKKTSEVPGGEDWNCDMWNLGGRNLFKKKGSDEIGTQRRKGSLLE